MASTAFSSDNSENTSAQDQLLTSVSPLRNLLFSILFIGILMLCVYIYWIIFRLRARKQGQTSQYGTLKETSMPVDIESPSERGARLGTPGKKNEDKFTVESTDASREGIILPQAIIIGLKTDKPKDSKPKCLSSINIKAASDLATTGTSTEALIATHIRQTEQRERFIHDRRNIGLRHMALQQIREQQKYEKRIMHARAAR